MRSFLAVLSSLAIAAGCATQPPYRTGQAGHAPGCEATYEAAYGAGADAIRNDRADPARAACWDRSSERHRDFDLFTFEFDDQGWWAGASERRWTAATTSLDDFTRYLEDKAARSEPLSIVVYTHGWHHSAAPDDSNVIAFRTLLLGMAAMERAQQHNQGRPKPRRVVGVYLGWRGDSVLGPLIDNTSIWDRKLAAEKVALGSAQELFAVLHDFYMRNGCHSPRSDWRCALESDVRMLTIGHSFGGLITYRALAPRLMTGIVERGTFGSSKPGDYAYSFGDLTVLINPAFEGTRFEALARAAAGRPYAAGKDPRDLAQLPVLLVAQSVGDVATGTFFPLFRHATSFFEGAEGVQEEVNVHAVGWIDRYITHDLRSADTSATCPGWPRDAAPGAERVRARVAAESAYLDTLRAGANKAFHGALELCGDLKALPAPKRWTGTGLEPWVYSPLWVLRTETAVVKNHNDFLNGNFQVFVRQMYMAHLKEKDRWLDAAICRGRSACGDPKLAATGACRTVSSLKAACP